MDLQTFLAKMANIKPHKPYIMGSGKANKYHPTSLDGNRVLGSGAIVARTVSVNGKPAPLNYDEAQIKSYVKSVGGK